MDKLLEFIVSYLKEILNKEHIDKLQLFLLVIVFSILRIIAFFGLNNGENNNVLQNMATFSFYTCVIMVIFLIIGIGGINKENDDLKDVKEYLRIFSGKKDYINFFNKNRKILVVYKLAHKYEINIWLNNDKFYGQIYVYFVSKDLQDKFLKNSDLLVQDKNEGFEKCLNYKDKNYSLDEVPGIIENIKTELAKLK